MVEFKERITKNGSNQHIFDSIKRKKWRSFEDPVKRMTKIKIDGKIKDIVKQKSIIGLLAEQSEQSILPTCPCFITSWLSRQCSAKNKKNLIYRCN